MPDISDEKNNILGMIIGKMIESIRGWLNDEHPDVDKDSYIESKYHLIVQSANYMYDSFDGDGHLEYLEHPENDWFDEWINPDVYIMV